MGGREVPTGAFYDVKTYGYSVGYGDGGIDVRFGMSLANVNSLYGNSSTIQPNSIYTLIIIKV